VEQAKKRLIRFPLKEGTLTHRIIGRYGSNSVVMNPAPKGTGLIAGGAVRAVFEVSGVQDVVAKSLGGHNPFNSVKATLDGLSNLKDPDVVLKMRGKAEEEPALEEASQ
jgi:small subunit ribosomal protein S5